MTPHDAAKAMRDEAANAVDALRCDNDRIVTCPTDCHRHKIVQILCVGCGASFSGRARRRYCSLPCMGRSRRTAIIRCATCQSEIHKTRAAPGRARVYCSKNCYTLAQTAPPTTIVCGWCRREVTRSGRAGYDLRRRNAQFCSLSCFHQSRSNVGLQAGRHLRAMRKSKSEGCNRGPIKTRARNGR